VTKELRSDAPPDFFHSDREVVLSLRGIEMVFPGDPPVTALSSFSLDIHKGEFVCILGPSGCGKSTLLSIIAGFLRPTSGVALVEGEPIVGMDRHRGMMFQSPTLYPWLDIYNNVAFGPQVQGVPKAEYDPKVRKYIDMVGLRDFVNAKPYELSGGMRQRTALARALVNEPSIILMDEPLGALDALTRNSMQVQIRDIWRETGMTALLITHDVDEALSLASRIVVMSARPGRIIGQFDAMFAHPLTGTDEDDLVRASDEYISTRRNILNLIGNH